MKHFVKLYFITLGMLLLCAVPSWAQKIAANDALRQLIEMYHADRGNLQRFYTIDHSPERRERFKTLAQSYLTQLQPIDYNALDAGGRVDYLLIKRDWEDVIYQSQEEATAFQQLANWFPFAQVIYDAEKARRRGLMPDSPKLASELNQCAKQIVSLQAKLKETKTLTKDLSNRGSRIALGLKSALNSVYSFYNGYDPMFTWWMAKPYAELDSVLKGYSSAFLKATTVSSQVKNDASGIVGNPIGKEELTRKLKLEMIPYSPEELVEIANKEFAWCDAEMLKASREMGFGDNWKAALEKVKQTAVPPGQQPAAMVKLYEESIAFLKDNNLITIPPLAEETWRLSMMSPERQLVNPFFLGGEEFIVSYPTNTMTHDQKMMSMRGNNPHFSRATVHHELIAGHGLQSFMTRRYKTYRHFETPFWVEGWSLYWEMLLYDLKFPRSAEDRVGMLFWRMHRCARIIFSLNYHIGKWSPQECIDFLVDRVGHEYANAEGEVRRSFVGGYDPLYQIAYMIGGLQIRALKDELVGTKKMTYQQFHDQFMQENKLPIEMMRAILSRKLLPKDYQTNWRFYSLK
ncbi:DUF885 family protein [Flectobacillus longus]|uniref:DUF885 family protein n=1 Tax=Flectobacillus longus TaxID=2984207 RepID=UPI0024B67744|nr:DUF885 family protein [Flectobacillus longus]MDI9878864.1 DUF885 family protein [Flectobacillus longus]